VLVAMCLGLRRSEIAGLKWSDFDWTAQQVLIQRSVIANRVDAVKTKRSKARLPLVPRSSRYSRIGAKSQNLRLTVIGCGLAVCCGRDAVLPERRAARLHHPGWQACEPGRIRWLAYFRHTYRTWMDANGTPLGIQQDLMRHANISMTTKYGSSMAEGMRAANSAVVRMAIQ